MCLVYRHFHSWCECADGVFHVAQHDNFNEKYSTSSRTQLTLSTPYRRAGIRENTIKICIFRSYTFICCSNRFQTSTDGISLRSRPNQFDVSIHLTTPASSFLQRQTSLGGGISLCNASEKFCNDNGSPIF